MAYSTWNQNPSAATPIWIAPTLGTPVHIFGYSGALGATAFGPLWEGLTSSGGAYVPPASAAQLTIVSTSTSDTSALSILVSGLDSGYNAISETIALNGTTAVTTVNSYLRVNSMATTNGINVGTITAKISTTLYAQINAGIGQTQMSIYTVPKGKTFYLYSMFAASNLGSVSSNWITYQEYNKFNLTGGNSSVLGQQPFVWNLTNDYRANPIAHPGGTDIQFQMLAHSGTTNIASVDANGVLL